MNGLTLLLLAALQGGVGIEFEKADFTVVIGTLPCSPADLAGIKTGARIVEVDGIPTSTMKLEEFARRIRGEVESKLRLTVQNGTAIKEYTLVRKLLTTKGCSEQLPSSIQNLFKKIQEGKYEETRKILERKPALIDETNDDGETPLMVAAAIAEPKFVKLLLSFHANVKATDMNGWTPLHWATSESAMALGRPDEVSDVLKCLLEAGANPNSSSREGWTPLTNAVQNNDVASASLLMKHGADPSLRNNGGETSLDIAKRNHNTDMQKALQSSH